MTSAKHNLILLFVISPAAAEPLGTTHLQPSYSSAGEYVVPDLYRSHRPPPQVTSHLWDPHVPNAPCLRSESFSTSIFLQLPGRASSVVPWNLSLPLALSCCLSYLLTFNFKQSMSASVISLSFPFLTYSAADSNENAHATERGSNLATSQARRFLDIQVSTTWRTSIICGPGIEDTQPSFLVSVWLAQGLIYCCKCLKIPRHLLILNKPRRSPRPCHDRLIIAE